MEGLDSDPAAPVAIPVGPTVVGALLSAGVGAFLAAMLALATVGSGGARYFALAGALGAFAWYLINAVNRGLADSERRMAARLGESALSAADDAPMPQRPAAQYPAQERESPVSSVATEVDPQPVAESAPPAPQPAPQPTASAWPDGKGRKAAPADDFASRALRYVRAWFRRGNPIARAGVVILFIGGAFLVKYAADHALLPLELRLAAVAAAAIVLLGVGWRLRHRQRVYALTLQGGGVAALYLTVYATLRLYSLIPPGIALALMAAVSLAAAVLAVMQRAPALAVIGFAGGFAAPLLASSGGGNHIALFSYYTVLNLGVFAIAWFRAWRVLNLVGFVFTFGVSAMWRGYGYAPDQLPSTLAFLLLFFLLYVAVSVLFALRQPRRGERGHAAPVPTAGGDAGSWNHFRERHLNVQGYMSGTLVFGLPVVVFALLGTLVGHLQYALAWAAFGFALFYVALSWALFLLRLPQLRLLAEAFAALGVIFGSLAIPLAFDQNTTAAIWAVEGAGLVWLGIRQKRRLARAFGGLLQLAAAGHYLTGLSHASAQTVVFHSAFMGGAGLAVAGFLSGLWMYRARQQLERYEKHAYRGLLLWALFWWLSAGMAEVGRFAPATLDAGISMVFLAASVLLLDLIGRRTRWPGAFAGAPLLAAALLGAASLSALAWMHHPLASGAWFGWPLLWLGYYWLLYRRDGDAELRLLAPLDRWLHAFGLWMLAVIAVMELRWQIGRQIAGVWPELVWGLVPALLLWLCAHAPGWPLARHRAAYRLVAALPLAAVALLWILIGSLKSSGDPVLLAYVPLLNPLDIAVMLVLLALATWWLALPGEERTRLRGGHPALLPAVIAGLVFLWLSSALIRAMHYLTGTPLLFDGVMHATPVQAALSIFWGLLGFAAMIAATRRNLRVVWLCGAGLMAVVVAKLFLVDLAATGTLARIISFLGVGALLLVTGYFSPLPPRRADDTETTA